jgi:hypothetical protein
MESTKNDRCRDNQITSGDDILARCGSLCLLNILYDALAGFNVSLTRVRQG